jgi:hypothetical protein
MFDNQADLSPVRKRPFSLEKWMPEFDCAFLHSYEVDELLHFVVIERRRSFL